ncbi:hypothetical protein [Chromobacterium vaccinii]|uniref:hypothetical protein n=1 Tax=Chromobacterium vaccinii TaxID=1108595 RepID=UPI0031D3A7DB
MKILIVVGEGVANSSGVSVLDQSLEFYGYGLELVKKYLRFREEDSKGVGVAFYIPGSISQQHSEYLNIMSEAMRTSVVDAAFFYDSIAGLMEALMKARNERTCLIVIGHGFQIIGGGAVQLLNGKGADKCIEDKDINAIRPDVYIGLHCYPGAILNKLSNSCIACGLTGLNVGQNGHIKNFCESDKLDRLFEDVCQLFFIVDIEDMDTPTINEHEKAVIQALKGFKDHSTPEFAVTETASLALSKS